jgi:tripartite-type tricarboxylate transporter receptor subunit TctC/DNA-binding IscR family transcriptional regulator
MKSTKLVTATYILSYVAEREPEIVTSDAIAVALNEHSSRIRQLLSALVKGGLLVATRGSQGGVSLAREPRDITLRQVQDAVGDPFLLSLNMPRPGSEWIERSNVRRVFLELEGELGRRISAYLDERTLDMTYTPLFVPFAPGGGTDILARTLGDALNLGRVAPVLVEYLPLTTTSQSKAASSSRRRDASELIIATASGVMPIALSPDGDMQLAAFTPVLGLTRAELIMAVASDTVIDSIEGLLQSDQTRSGLLSFASIGAGSMSHLATSWLLRESGTRMNHRPYPGARAAVDALLSKEVDVYLGTPPTLLQHLNSGRLRALATTGAKRSAFLPDVPTVSELFPGFEVTAWQAVFMRASTPALEIKRMRDQIAAALEEPYVSSRLRRQGIRVNATPPELFERQMIEEIARWRKRVVDWGISLDESPVEFPSARPVMVGIPAKGKLSNE